MKKKLEIDGIIIDTSIENVIALCGSSYSGSYYSETDIYVTKDKKQYFYETYCEYFSEKQNRVCEVTKFGLITEKEVINRIENSDDREVCSISYYVARGAREILGLTKIGRFFVDSAVFYEEYNCQLADHIFESNSMLHNYKLIFDILRLQRNYELHRDELVKQYSDVDEYICDAFDNPEIMKQFRQEEINYYVEEEEAKIYIASCPVIDTTKFKKEKSDMGDNSVIVPF